MDDTNVTDVKTVATYWGVRSEITVARGEIYTGQFPKFADLPPDIQEALRRWVTP